MHDEELTCGQELAQNAEVPEAIGALMTIVALNLEAHARWVGGATPDAKREHEAMLAVASAYRAIGAAGSEAGRLMRSFEHLTAVPHDPAGRDVQAFASWMRAKMELQRKVGNMLLAHAELSEAALAQALR
jgi:hypothetical protein